MGLQIGVNTNEYFWSFFLRRDTPHIYPKWKRDRCVSSLIYKCLSFHIFNQYETFSHCSHLLSSTPQCSSSGENSFIHIYLYRYRHFSSEYSIHDNMTILSIQVSRSLHLNQAMISLLELQIGRSTRWNIFTLLDFLKSNALLWETHHIFIQNFKMIGIWILPLINIQIFLFLYWTFLPFIYLLFPTIIK